MSDINNKWTKGRVLLAFAEDFKEIGFRINDKHLTFKDDVIEIQFDVDLDQARDLRSGASDIYVKFIAQLNQFRLSGTRLWPAAMDLQFIVSESTGQRNRAYQPYLLAANEGYNDSILSQHIKKYVVPFTHLIQSEEGYFNFLLRKSYEG